MPLKAWKFSKNAGPLENTGRGHKYEAVLGYPLCWPKKWLRRAFLNRDLWKEKMLFIFQKRQCNLDGTIPCFGWTHTMPPAPGSMWTIDSHFHSRWIWSAGETSVDFLKSCNATSPTGLNTHYSFTTRVQVKHPMPSCCLSIMSFYIFFGWGNTRLVLWGSMLGAFEILKVFQKCGALGKPWKGSHIWSRPGVPPLLDQKMTQKSLFE